MGQKLSNPLEYPSSSLSVSFSKELSTQLNDDIINCIVEFLPDECARNFENTCSRFFRLCNQRDEAIWKYRCIKLLEPMNKTIIEDSFLELLKPKNVKWKHLKWRMNRCCFTEKGMYNAHFVYPSQSLPSSSSSSLPSSSSSSSSSPILPSSSSSSSSSHIIFQKITISSEKCPSNMTSRVYGEQIFTGGKIYKWQFHIDKVPESKNTMMFPYLTIGVKSNSTPQTMWNYIYGFESEEIVGYCPDHGMKRFISTAVPYYHLSEENPPCMGELKAGEIFGVELDMTFASEAASKRINQLKKTCGMDNTFHDLVNDLLSPSVRKERERLGCSIRFFRNGIDLGIAFCALPFHDLRIALIMDRGYQITLLPLF